MSLDTATPEVELPSVSPPPATTTATALSKRKKPKRLPNDILGQLEDDLKLNPLNLTTWLSYIEQVEKKDKIEQVRQVYETFLKKFPQIITKWIDYINYELNRSEFDKVEEIFKTILITKNYSNIELWKVYIDYIRRKNNLITGGDDSRRIIFQAFEQSLLKIGIDPESGSLWEEYLSFIESWKPSSKYDEQQKMDLKRKIYKKALVLPLNNLEKLWNDYTVFENQLNNTTARKFISEISGAYMNARSWYKEWIGLVRGIDRDDSIIPNDNRQENLRKFHIWLKWIQLENLNKLELTQDVVLERVEFVYRQAITKLIFLPEIWFEYVEFMKTNANTYSNVKIQQVLNESLLINPVSFLLNFKIIELYELESNVNLVIKKYDTLIEHLTIQHGYKLEEIDELKEELVNNELELKNAKKDEQDDDIVELNEDEKTTLFKSNDTLQSLINSLNKLSKTITLTYVQYMKSIKNLKSLKDSRLIFASCRKSEKTLTHDIFVENAKLEFIYGEREKNISIKVFELGLRKNFFPNDGEYIYKYLKFLIKINDGNNAKSLFESTINNKKELIDLNWLKKIFKIYFKYEVEFGQISSLAKLEEKYFSIFPTDSKLELFADRYSFNDVVDFDIENDLIRFNDLKQTQTIISTKSDTADFNSIESSVESDYELEGKRKTDDDLDQGNESKRLKLDETVEDSKDFVSDEIYNLLRVLPKANNFDKVLFDNTKLIDLLARITV